MGTTILPTNAQISKATYGYASPTDAFVQGFQKRYEEVAKLRENEKLLNQAIGQYNDVNPDEADYQRWLEQNQGTLPIDKNTLNPTQARMYDVINNIKGIVDAKKSYGQNPNASAEADKYRGLLKALGIDPEKIGLGANGDVATAEGMYNNYNDSFTKQIQEQAKRRQFAQTRPNMRSGVPFMVNPNMYRQPIQNGVSPYPPQARPENPWLQNVNR